ncbi:MAG: PilZ domain-containing protein [Bacteriovoracaceae bacterium]|nr:PilZ domain-containing protein [Bacteriovoracaceae bacterium]
MNTEVVKDVAIIQNMFENSRTFNSPITINQPGIQTKAKIVAVNINTNELVIRPFFSGGSFPEFIDTGEILISNKSNSIVYRTSFRGKVRPFLAIIKIPDLLIIRNMRQTNRTNLEHISLPVHFKNFTIFDYVLRNQQIEANIFDLSDSGIALSTEFNEIDNFKENDKIIFTLVNGYSFNKKVEGRLIYVNENSDYQKEQNFKIGIAFSDDTSGITFKKFIENQIILQS